MPVGRTGIITPGIQSSGLPTDDLVRVQWTGRPLSGHDEKDRAARIGAGLAGFDMRVEILYVVL